MRSLLSLTLAASLIFGSTSAPDTQKLVVLASQGIPKAATIEIVLNAPGLNQGSRWEVAYEFRIINQADDWVAWKQGKFKDGGGKRVGELLKEGNVREMLQTPADRRILLRIPFGPEIQERLRNQPRAPLNITSGSPTPEEIKVLREREIRSQIFLFYSVINIYVAKLKKNVPVSRVWTFADYPDAKFEIKVEINEDGSYSVKSSLPKNATGRQLEIRQ